MAKKTKKLLTVKQVSEMTSISESSLYAGLLGTNELKRAHLQTKPTSRVTLRFEEEDVLAWIERKLSPPAVTVEAPKRRRGQITDDDRIVSMYQWKQKRG